MPRKRLRPEDVIMNLREADVLLSPRATRAEVAKGLGVTEVTRYRWRKEYGGMKVSQARHLRELEREKAKLRKAVSEVTAGNLILQETARGTFLVLSAAGLCASGL